MTPRDRFDSLFAFWATHDRKGHRGPYSERPAAVDWTLLKRQALAESGMEPDAISPVGAAGLTQFIESTWKEWVVNEFGPEPPARSYISPFDPEDSIRAQADMMAWLLKVWKGDERKALASYNAGIGRVTRLIRDHGEEWESHLPDETRGYLAKILGT